MRFFYTYDFKVGNNSKRYGKKKSDSKKEG